MLSDGSVVHFRPLDAAASCSRRCAADTLEARVLSHRAASWRATHRDEIDRRFPKVLRRVGGYNLDEFTQAGPAHSTWPS